MKRRTLWKVLTFISLASFVLTVGIGLGILGGQFIIWLRPYVFGG